MAADADVEPAREHEVGEPERDPGDATAAERDHRLPQPLAVGGEHEHGLSGEDEGAVGMRGDARAGSRRPRASRLVHVPRSSARSRRTNDSSERNRNRLYIRA